MWKCSKILGDCNLRNELNLSVRLLYSKAQHSFSGASGRSNYLPLQLHISQHTSPAWATILNSLV